MPTTFGPASGTSNPVTILVGQGGDGNSPTQNITRLVPLETLRIEESGNHEQAVADFEIFDRTTAYAAIRGEWKVFIQHGTSPVFRGFIRQSRGEIRAIYGGIVVSAYDVGSLLDKLIVDVIASRKNSESDKTRLQWLFDTYGQPFVTEGFTDWSKVQVLDATMPDPKFPPTLTLRQAVERILGAASDSANYYVDYVPRLHTFDDDNQESAFVAPFDVKAGSTLSASEIAPEDDLNVEWDTSNLVNWYYVRGKNAAGTGNYNDYPMTAPSSIPLYGTRKAYLDAPDADTQAKAQRVARAALRDTRYPVCRGSFTVSGTNCENSSGNRWQAGQLVYVTSSVHGLTGRTADMVLPTLQPFRIVRVTTQYLSGKGLRSMDVEFGGRRAHLFSP